VAERALGENPFAGFPAYLQYGKRDRNLLAVTGEVASDSSGSSEKSHPTRLASNALTPLPFLGTILPFLNIRNETDLQPIQAHA